MKRDFTAVLTNLEGEPFKDGQPKYKVDDAGKLVFANSEPIVLEPAKDLTLRAVCVGAIGTTQEGDDKMSGEDKVKLYQLADRIVKACKAGEPAEVSPEEITKLKARIARQYTVFAVGAAFALLDADYVAGDAA
jgi:hypothetical protein